MSQAERRQMKMHPRLLWDVIHRQAGTLSKAILEGVMNSVDAGASYCDVTIDRETFSIADDGKGFASDEEIEKFFETFGYPHEEGDATYGRFRMGRGQIMSFGRSEWVTNHYRMSVDFKPQQDQKGDDFALGYDFKKVEEKAKGCRVDVALYDKLSPSQLDSAIREITEYVRYVNIPVRLNGKVISTDPAKETWDEITPDAYIKRRASGSLDVYNQGVLVTKYPSYRFGLSGVVASKEPLDVNFARNDVQSTCPRWKRIVRVLREDVMEQATRNAPLTEAQRDFFARQLASGEAHLHQVEDARIVTDITGSHHPFSIFTRLDRFQNKLSIAKRGDRVAEMAHTRRMGFFVTDECAARFGADSPEELVRVLRSIHEANRKPLPAIVPVEREEYNKVISSSHEPVADKELNKAERLAIKAIREGAALMHRLGSWRDHQAGTDVFRRGREYGARRISVGVSDTAHAWTDGTHNIWIERGRLKLVKEGHKGMMKLAGLLLHEYLHNEASTGTHEHGVEFYNRFHDIALQTDIITSCADQMMKTVLKELRSANQAVSAQLTRFEDNVAEAADRGLGSYDAEPEEVAAVEVEMVQTVHEAPEPPVEAEPFVPEVPEDEAPAEEPAPSMAACEQVPVRKPKRRKEDDGSQMTLGF